MKTNSISFAVTAGILAAVLGLAAAPAAHPVSYSAAAEGITPPVSAAFTPSGGQLSLTTVAGFTMLGVRGSPHTMVTTWR